MSLLKIQCHNFCPHGQQKRPRMNPVPGPGEASLAIFNILKLNNFSSFKTLWLSCCVSSVYDNKCWRQQSKFFFSSLFYANKFKQQTRISFVALKLYSFKHNKTLCWSLAVIIACQSNILASNMTFPIQSSFSICLHNEGGLQCQ